MTVAEQVNIDARGIERYVKVGQEGNINHGPTSALNLFHTITTKLGGAGINSIE